MNAYKVALIGLFATILGIAHAGIIGPGAAVVTSLASLAPPSAAATLVRTDNYDPHPQYSFSYSVADGLTGDNKAQQETRNGDVVQGSYSLIEPDGSRRVVSYAADPINGFNAVVQKDPSITVKTAAAAIAPLSTALRPAILASSLVARARARTATAGAGAGAGAGAPPAIAVRSQIQPIITGHGLTATNVLTDANTAGVIDDIGLGLGLSRSAASLYGTQALLTSAYGTGGIVKLH